MLPEPKTISVDELLAHEEWVRRLAVRLTSDPEHADDLVQLTWLAALDAPPLRSPRAWLGRVLQNQAIDLRRSESARSDSESRLDSPPAEESAADVAARADLRDHLAALMQGLAEPYRSTLLLRFYEGASSEQIGALHEVPSSTVRWRVKQGLELLREKLDDRYGDRRQWLAVAGLWLPRREAHAAGAAGLVASGLGRLWMVVIALTALGGLGALYWNGFAEPPELISSAESRRPPGGEEVPVSLMRGARTERARIDAGPRNGAEPEVDPLVHIAPGAAALDAATSGTTPVLHLRVGDAQGRPISGAHVAVRIADESGARGVTDADGSAAVLLEPRDFEGGGFPEGRGMAAVRVSADGYRTSHLQHVSPEFVEAGSSTPLELTLLSDALVAHGRVVDAEGRGVASARVAMSFAGAFRQEVFDSGRMETDAALITRTGPDGNYTLRGLEPREIRIRIGATGFVDFEVVRDPREQRSVEWSYTLVRGATVRGVVLGPEARPVSGAQVWFEPTHAVHPQGNESVPGYVQRLVGFSRIVRADASGAFELDSVPPGDALLWAQDPNRPALVASVTMQLEASQSASWEPNLRKVRPLEARVIDAEGSPANEPGRLFVGFTRGLRELRQWDRFVPVDETGLARVWDVPPIPVMASLFGPRMEGGIADSQVGETAAERSFSLRLAPGEDVHVTGILRDSSGAPLGPATANCYLYRDGRSGTMAIENDGTIDSEVPQATYNIQALIPRRGAFAIGDCDFRGRAAAHVDWTAPLQGTIRCADSPPGGAEGWSFRMVAYSAPQKRWEREVLLDEGQGLPAETYSVYPGLVRCTLRKGVRSHTQWLFVRAGREALLDLSTTQTSRTPVRARTGGDCETFADCRARVFRIEDGARQPVWMDEAGERALLEGLWLLPLAPGDYDIEATSPNGLSAAGRVRIEHDSGEEILALVLR